MALHITQDPDADALLSSDPLALVIGMVLDQQVPLERAFRAPLDLRRRLGDRLDAGEIAAMDPDELAALFSAKPALHRFPTSMAQRVQAVCALVAERHAGDASGLWSGAPDGETLVSDIAALPGFGPQKARIFVALLGKQLGVRPPGWREACAPFGEPGTARSVADIDSPDTLAQVRQAKQRIKAAARSGASKG
jgi:uncharacterized HhH-GPD family protein